MKIPKLYTCFTTCIFLLLSCSTDPMNMKYTNAEGIQPLLSKDINPPIDERILEQIKDAELTNQRNGIDNEGKTFKELSDQGLTQWSERKARAIADSIMARNKVKY